MALSGAFLDMHDTGPRYHVDDSIWDKGLRCKCSLLRAWPWLTGRTRQTPRRLQPVIFRDNARFHHLSTEAEVSRAWDMYNLRAS